MSKAKKEAKAKAPKKAAVKAVKEKKVAKPAVKAAVKSVKKTAVVKSKVVKVVHPKVEVKPQVKIEPVVHAPKVEVKPYVKIEPVVHAPKVHPKVEVKPPAKIEPVVHQPKVEPKIHPKVEPVPQPQVITPPPAPIVELKEIELQLPISVKDLSIKLQEKPSTLIKDLMSMRIMVGINQNLDDNITEKLCAKYKFKIKKAPDQEELMLEAHAEEDKPADLKPRSPIVTIMGHVDHGKTSLLDAIRKTNVAGKEHGGITQHIGAYRVKLPGGEITFLDTPGHEAFTAMRARGASITDIVVLVVAADDGIMPQTQEAIDHARAAGVTIIVAVNKIDKPGADLDKVKKQLSQLDLMAEDWGGKTITVGVSAKTGEGIDTLLEMILLEAQMLELKANPNRLAKGVVIEAKMSKGRGPVSTLLVQNGTLHLNANIIVGNFYGKVRAMFDDHGNSAISAGPGVPVEALGITGIPAAGEQFFVIVDEKEAKELVDVRQDKEKAHAMRAIKRVSLEDLHEQISAGKIKDLKIIVKADVQGSLEAIKDTLYKLNVTEIKIGIIHAGVGNINSSDAILAAASNALVVGFNVAIDDLARELVAKEGVEVKIYNIIYELANEIKQAVVGMLAPRLNKISVGRAEIRKVFKLSKSGTVAGCFVTKGKIVRTNNVSLVRNGTVVFEGKLSALKRFKDDVRDVQEGFECGMSFAGYTDFQEGDIIEAYEIEKIARTF